MKYRVSHTSKYIYSESVSRCHNEVRMTPLNNRSQTVEKTKAKVFPAPQKIFERLDYFGNKVASFDIHREHKILTVTVVSEVLTLPPPQPTVECEKMPWHEARDIIQTSTNSIDIEAQEYLLASPLVPLDDEIKAYAQLSFTEGRPVFEALQDLTTRIYTDFSYEPGFTTISTPLSEVMEHRKGVCQDFAHLQIACVRSMDLPAAYVSGYLETDPPPGKVKLVGSDASHAWLSVYIPGFGWQDFDPTNNQQPNERYVTVAVGRDYADVTPLKGVIYGGGAHKLEVKVDVAPMLASSQESA
ncbi:transglutaminase family protein [Dasania marina]|uniref:transglutaminase family protein n=1 Tax=Dasania marina TaxID=471499 RepID=UPI0030D92CD6|tara:strand:- start:21498 stop:22397 length:900 start_codon:yes stop_codon:yes gene_type:complete